MCPQGVWNNCWKSQAAWAMAKTFWVFYGVQVNLFCCVGLSVPQQSNTVVWILPAWRSWLQAASLSMCIASYYPSWSISSCILCACQNTVALLSLKLILNVHYSHFTHTHTHTPVSIFLSLGSDHCVIAVRTFQLMLHFLSALGDAQIVRFYLKTNKFLD